MNNLFIDIIRRSDHQNATVLGFIHSQMYGLALFYKRRSETQKSHDAERNQDMALLQGEMQDVIDAAETFEKEVHEREEQVRRL